MINTWKYRIGILISLALLVWFLATIEIQEMLNSLLAAQYVYLLPGILLYIFGVYLRAVRWKLLLNHIKSINTLKLFSVVTIGYMANNILPFRLGELIRSYYISETEDISKTTALVSIFVERILDSITLLFFIAAISLVIPLYTTFNSIEISSSIIWKVLIIIFTLIFLGSFLVLMFSSFFPEQIRDKSSNLIRYFPDRFQQRAITLVEYFLEAIKPLRNPRTLGNLFLLSVPIWLLEAGLFTSIAYSFGIQNNFPGFLQLLIAMTVITSAANIGSSLPAAPGGIGLFEIITREALILLSIIPMDRTLAAGFATITHAALLLPMILLGQIFLWTNHVSLKKLSMAGRTKESPTPSQNTKK